MWGRGEIEKTTLLYIYVAMQTNGNNVGHAPQDVTQLPKSAGTSNWRLAARKHASSVLVATGDVILTCVYVFRGNENTMAGLCNFVYWSTMDKLQSGFVK